MEETAGAAATMTAPAETSPAPTGASAETPPQSEPQATEPQAQPNTESTPAVETPTLSPRDRLRETLKDPELQSAYRDALNAEAQRIAAKQLKRERLSRAREDPVAALEYAQEEAQAVEAEETRTTQEAERYTKAQASLSDLWKNKEWAKVYNELREAEGAKFHQEWARDPDGFVDKLDDRITEMLIDRRASVKAKAMAEAMALEETNRRLGNLPIPPTGNAGGGGVPTLAEIDEMSPAEYRKHRDKVLANLDQYRR